VTIPEALTIAVQLHQTGRLADAEAIYRQILAAQPRHADALHLLGVIALQVGRHDSAVEWIRQAIAVNPAGLDYHYNVGIALAAQGRLEEAIDAFHRALETKPDFPETHYNLANALRDRGRLGEAIAAYRHALRIKPNFAEAHTNLGNALKNNGQLEEAIAAHHRALEFSPHLPEVHINLGTALAEQGRFEEAIAAYRRALELKPDCPEALNNLGALLAGRNQLDAAIAMHRRAIELKANYAEAHNNLGTALKNQGELTEAIVEFRRAIQWKPEYSAAHSNLIYALHYHPGHGGKQIVKEHQRWNRQFSDSLKSFIEPHLNDPANAGRLRIGYVSPDFRDHPVGRYLLPLFKQYDREQFEAVCYSGVAQPDWMTERFRALAVGWRNTVGMSDAQVAGMIREDRVDILVDLAMHTAGNRLLVFARQPAPVQVAWLAYPGSPGLPSIGHRLTDALIDPPAEKPPHSAEEPVRLPHCWCCYDAEGDSPEVNELPALSAGRMTFGSLNNFAKVNESVLALWALVLDSVKGSRLVLLCPEGRTRERVRKFFGSRGVSPERVEFVGFLPRLEFLSLYQRIDIALDPFPCNGMTTTCDALWMGAPVLTLPGEIPVSRAGLSLLSTIGLGEFAAASEEDYVRSAAELAGNLPRLTDLRATLRARMQASPLMDAPRFARNVEAAYRSIWERWCAADG
jgi:protein O-GlcNAc transferase